MMKQFRSILTFEKPSILKEIRIGYTIERVEHDVLSVKNFDITKKYVEDAKYVANVANVIQIVWKMNAKA